MRAYAARWLEQIAVTVKPRTLESYERTLRLHVLPVLGARPVRQLDRGRIKALLVAHRQAGAAKDSTRIVHATLRGLLSSAIDDGIVASNAAARLGKALKLETGADQRQEQIKAMTREQLSAFLTAAPRVDRRTAPFWLLQARAGLRLGEARAVQWPDLHWNGHEITVARALAKNNRIETPKSGHGRTVDMSEQLATALRRLQIERKTETLRRGSAEVPSGSSVRTQARPLDDSRVRKVFARVLKAAGLPGHFSPHSLRHTFASLLLQQGESPAYVQRQLGHASIKLTVDTYGKWLPMGNKAAVNRLDDAPGQDVTDRPCSGRPRARGQRTWIGRRRKW